MDDMDFAPVQKHGRPSRPLELELALMLVRQLQAGKRPGLWVEVRRRHHGRWH